MTTLDAIVLSLSPLFVYVTFGALIADNYFMQGRLFRRWVIRWPFLLYRRDMESTAWIDGIMTAHNDGVKFAKQKATYQPASDYKTTYLAAVRRYERGRHPAIKKPR